MTNDKEIEQLHNKGFVILRAARTTNAPIGWKHKSGKWGYVDEMADASLSVYHSTFNATMIARSHCGFYLGHGNLCCIDLDVKKLDDNRADVMVQAIIKTFRTSVVVERTKSNGYHIYFLYKKRLDNVPNFTGLGAKNWIELYYQKRFIACYLSNSKKYHLEHGDLFKLKPLNDKQHEILLQILKPFKGKTETSTKRRTKTIEVDATTWERAESYVKQIEAKGLDITGDNPLWFRIGKAFASAFGQKGFDLFNRVSAFSPLYNADTIETDYTSFVNGDTRKRNKKITIATFFKMCDDNGLHDLETTKALQLHPPKQVKEFDLLLTKKERMAEHVHTLVSTFIQHVEICCIDQQSFYVYENTHWQRRNAKQIVDLINDFVDRSNVEDRFRKLLRTLPYLEMAIRELRLTTQRDALEPHTGNLNEGIYINMENGVLHVNMKTGKRKLLDHEAKYNFTTVLPYCYEPTATSPRFDKWLNVQIPDKALHTAYYAFVASCLTRHRADIIMLLAGETSTGKSSLIDITRRIIGLENSVAVSAGILFSGTSEAQTQAMQMENKLLAYDFDSQPFKHLEMLLKVAAQEPLPGWQMHVARRPVVNYGRLLIAMNPYSYSVFNPAVARRLITINMDVKVEKDNAVMPAIYDEVAGVFNHILNVGVKHLLENGGQILVTENMRRTTMLFHMKEKDAVRWFEAFYFKPAQPDNKSTKLPYEDKLKKANPGAMLVLTNITELYQKYKSWLEDIEGYSAGKLQLRKHFAADLKNYGIDEALIRLDGKVVRGVYVAERKD